MSSLVVGVERQGRAYIHLSIKPNIYSAKYLLSQAKRTIQFFSRETKVLTKLIPDFQKISRQDEFFIEKK